MPGLILLPQHLALLAMPRIEYKHPVILAHLAGQKVQQQILDVRLRSRPDVAAKHIRRLAGIGLWIEGEKDIFNREVQMRDQHLCHTERIFKRVIKPIEVDIIIDPDDDGQLLSYVGSRADLSPGSSGLRWRIGLSDAGILLSSIG